VPGKTKSVLSLLLVCFATALLAQQINFRNISNSLELPSQECYNVLQDSKGYIWICTENGLCRYNGNELKTFDKRNGLQEGAVYFIKEDEKGDLDLITSESRILKLTNNKIEPNRITFDYLAFLKKKSIERQYNISYTLNKNENNDLIVNTQSATYKILKSNAQITNLSEANLFNSDANFILISQTKEDYFIKNKPISVAAYQRKKYNITLDFISKGKKKRISIPFEKNNIPDWRVRICKANGYTFFCLQNNLIKIDSDLNCTILSLSNRIISMHVDKENGLWVGMATSGVNYYKDLNNMKEFQTALPGLSVSSIFKDKEGGVWCTTLEKGVYRSNNVNVIYYPNISNLAKKSILLKSINNVVFISTENDKLLIINKDTYTDKKLNLNKNVDITDVIRYKNDWYFSTKGYVGIADKNYTIKKTVRSKEVNTEVCLYQMDTSATNLYGIGVSSVYKLENKHFVLIGPELNAKGRCLKVLNDSIIYAGCSNGLYKINLNTGTQIKINKINSPVSKIVKTSNGDFYVATKGDGLFKLENDQAIKMELKNCTENTIFLDLAEDKNRILWAATPEGVVKIQTQNNRTQLWRYNVSNGLISNNIEQIAVNDQFLYISSSDGICRISLEKNLSNLTPPRLFISTVAINHKIINYDTKKLLLNHFENSIDIIFDKLSFSTGKKEGLYYKLVGEDEQFELSTNTKLSYNNLPPNDYELIVYALNNDGVRSMDPVRISFKIKLPFWSTPWFITSSLIVFFLLVYFVSKKTIRNVRLKEEEKTRINELISRSQLSALQAQMNPHFIFNAINSIQNYILNKRDEEAYDYLAKFSKLIRMVLNNSRESILPFSVEIETLNLYIELEQLRFSDSFDYRLSIDEEVNLLNIEIPTMLIQPYVENAIWHGLMNLKNERKAVLQINIVIESNFLKVVIEDNGVGRICSNEYKKGNIHHSVAMKLTEQRLEMIHKFENSKTVKVLVSDLYDAEKKACGTKVELFLPLLNQNYG